VLHYRLRTENLFTIIKKKYLESTHVVLNKDNFTCLFSFGLDLLQIQDNNNVFIITDLNTKTLITNKMQKESFIINCNTLLHASTLLGHLQGEFFVIVTLRLHFIVENVLLTVYCVVFGGVNSL
jgi:hypothetical protein